MTSATHTVFVATPAGELRLPFQARDNLRDILVAGGVLMHSNCGGNAVCGRCQVRVQESSDLPFTAGERLRLSGGQLADGVRLACQLKPESDLHVVEIRPVLQMGWRPLRDDEYGSMPFSVAGCGGAGQYGVAIDLGTTHIRLALWDMATGRRLAGKAGLNPQGSYGTDVLTRLMEAARADEVAQDLGRLVRQAIAEALAGIAAEVGLGLRGICRVRVVGNTAMLSLLAGKNYAQLLQPEYWTQPLDCQPQDVSFLSAAWGVDRAADIRLVSPLGGFIGSDLLAGVIATRVIEQEAGVLLIDFGTNSEMALWDGRILHVTSAAGGPAFEGSGISCGMPGEAGAIYRVSQHGSAGFDIRVLGDAEPLGVCGSGVVDAIAWLRCNGRLDKVGRFIPRDNAGFVLHDGVQRIELRPADIDVLQRAKAAIGAGVRWLCRKAGVRLDRVHTVYACGAFGRLLDAEHARQIGLLPPLASAAVKTEGNAALAGCEALLLAPEAERMREAVVRAVRVYNLAEDADFETLFVENLYLQPMLLDQ